MPGKADHLQRQGVAEDRHLQAGWAVWGKPLLHLWHAQHRWRVACRHDIHGVPHYGAIVLRDAVELLLNPRRCQVNGELARCRVRGHKDQEEEEHHRRKPDEQIGEHQLVAQAPEQASLRELVQMRPGRTQQPDEQQPAQPAEQRTQTAWQHGDAKAKQRQQRKQTQMGGNGHVHHAIRPLRRKVGAAVLSTCHVSAPQSAVRSAAAERGALRKSALPPAG